MSITDPFRHPTVQAIDRGVFCVYGVGLRELRNPCRWRSVSEARHVACYVLRELTPFSLPEIGRTLQRDHTTVMKSIQRVANSAALLAAAGRVMGNVRPVGTKPCGSAEPERMCS